MKQENKGFGRVTPVSNTGVKMPNDRAKVCLIDYLAGTFPLGNMEHIKLVVQTALLDCFSERKYGTTWYRRSWQSAAGAVLACDHVNEGENHGYLEMKGAVLARVKPGRLFRFFLRLQALGFRCSRIDTTIDDYARRFTPEQAAQAFQDGNVCGFRSSFTFHSSWSAEHKRMLSTATFGNRGKNGACKQVCIYDKGDRIRVELRNYKHKAAETFESICTLFANGLQTICTFIASIVAGAIDFREMFGKIRKARAVRVSWWESFIGDVEPLSFAKIIAPKTYERQLKYLKKQVAPTLATILQVMVVEGKSAIEYVWELALDGEERMSPEHKAILATAEYENKRKNKQQTNAA